jgi:hypothetical protein
MGEHLVPESAVQRSVSWIEAIECALGEHTDEATTLAVLKAAGARCAEQILDECAGILGHRPRTVSELLDATNERRQRQLGLDALWEMEEGRAHLKIDACGCTLVKAGLAKPNPVHCLCTVGMFETLFSAVGESQVDVEVVQTIGGGDRACEFYVSFGQPGLNAGIPGTQNSRSSGLQEMPDQVGGETEVGESLPSVGLRPQKVMGEAPSDGVHLHHEDHALDALNARVSHVAEVCLENDLASLIGQRVKLVARNGQRGEIEEDVAHADELPVDDADRIAVEDVPAEQVVVAERPMLGRQLAAAGFDFVEPGEESVNALGKRDAMLHRTASRGPDPVDGIEDMVDGREAVDTLHGTREAPEGLRIPVALRVLRDGGGRDCLGDHVPFGQGIGDDLRAESCVECQSKGARLGFTVDAEISPAVACQSDDVLDAVGIHTVVAVRQPSERLRIGFVYGEADGCQEVVQVQQWILLMERRPDGSSLFDSLGPHEDLRAWT